MSAGAGGSPRHPVGRVTGAGRRLAAALHAIARRQRGDLPRLAALGLLSITIACVLIPLLPVMPRPQLDEAWALGMNQAQAQGLLVGRDLYFTFGPYSAVFSLAYHPSTDALTLLASGYLALCYWLAIAELTRDARRYLPWVLLLLLASVLSARDARDTILLSYPLLVGLVCVRIATRAPAPPARSTTAIAIALTSAFGLLPQIKGSMAAACGLIGAVVFGLFALERRWRLAIAVVAAPLAGLVAFWELAGQSMAGLLGYVRSLAPIIADYADAMAIPGDPYEIVLYLVGCALLLAGVARQRDAPPRARWSLFGVFLAFLFLALKAGFVRHDSHAMIPAQGLLLAAVLFAGTAASRLKPAVLAAAVLAWGYIDRHHVKTSPGFVVEKIYRTYASAWEGLGHRLGSDGPEQDFHEVLRALAEAYGVRPLEGTTDVYSNGQTALIASGLRWSPRPVMQSYLAYDDYLGAKNRDHLTGDRAPDNVLFKIEPFDARLPALDDGASWPALLTRYRPVAFDHGFLILRRRDAAVWVDEPTTLETRTPALGRSVAVPEGDGLVIAEIDVRPSLLGKLAGALFKSNTLLITLNLPGGHTKTYRYIAAGGRLGLVISPLIEDTSEFASLYAGTSFVEAKRVVSFSIAPDGSKRLWQRTYRVTFKRLTAPPALAPRQLFELEHGVRELDEQVAAGVAADAVPRIGCEGVVDVINGFTTPPWKLSASGLVSVAGWTARSVKQAVLPRAVLLVLTDAEGRHTLFRTRPAKRPDVGTYFGDPRLEASGYTATIDVSRHQGTYTLGIAFQDGAAVELCEQFKYSLVIRAVEPAAAPPPG